MKTTWKILNLKRLVSNDLITEITYECKVTIDNNSSRTIGSIEISGDINDPNFIAFDDLTEEVANAWLMTALGDEATNIETKLVDDVNKKIEFKASRKDKKGLPWKNK